MKIFKLCIYCIISIIVLCVVSVQIVALTTTTDDIDVYSDHSAIKWYAIGQKNLNIGNYYEALGAYQQALEYNKYYAAALRGMAEVYFYLNEYDQAEVFIKRAAQYEPYDMDMRNIHGRIVLALGNVAQAKKIFNDILAQEPFNLDAHIGMSHLLLASGDVAGALNEYIGSDLDNIGAYAINPRDKRVLLGLAIIHEYEGNYQLAEKYLLQAIYWFSDDITVQLIAGEYYLNRYDFEKAQIFGQHAMSINPNSNKALWLMSEIYLHKKDYKESLAVLDKLIHKEPQNARIWYLRAYIFGELKEYEKGIEDIKRVLEITPDDEIARLLLEDLVRKQYPNIQDKQRLDYAQYHFQIAEKYIQERDIERSMLEYYWGLALYPMSITDRKKQAELYNLHGYQALYLEQLNVLVNQLNVKTNDVVDVHEIYNDILSERVSAKWSLDQFSSDLNNYHFRIFYKKNEQEVRHDHVVNLLIGMFQSVMERHPDVSFQRIERQGIEYWKPEEVTSEVQAFQIARTSEVDYYIMLDFLEDMGMFKVRAQVYVARTGTKIADYTAYRGGNFRVTNAIIDIDRELYSLLPKQGSLLDFNKNVGIINLGNMSNVKKNDVFLILKNNHLLLRSDRFGFVYDVNDVIGEFTVDKTDDLVSEGLIVNNNIISYLNKGNILIEKYDEPELAVDTSTIIVNDNKSLKNFPLIYQKIKNL